MKISGSSSTEKETVGGADRDAQNRADEHLQGGMPYEFLQFFLVGKGLSHVLKEVEHLIDDLSLDSGLAADTSGIVHDNDCHNGRYSEFEAADTVLHAGRCGKRTNRCGMGTGHAAAACQTFGAEAFIDAGIYDRFEQLRDKPSGDSSHKYSVIDQFHKKSHK